MALFERYRVAHWLAGNPPVYTRVEELPAIRAQVFRVKSEAVDPSLTVTTAWALVPSDEE